MVNRRSGKAAYCCRTHSVTDDDGRPARRYELVRPTRIERHRGDLFLETLWEEASAEEFASLWSTEVDELRDQTRVETIYLVTGLLLLVWGKLPGDHVPVWRLPTEDGQPLLGRLVPAPHGPHTAARSGGAAAVRTLGSGGVSER